MVSNTSFWDKAADKYAASPIKNVDAYNRTMERTQSYLSKESVVLEVGCGTGSTAILLAPHVQCMTGTDISRRMIEIGEEKVRKQTLSNVRFRQAALPDESLIPESFDAVLCFNTLHLVADIPSVLRNLHSALKPGGVFISKTVCLAEQTKLWGIPIYVLRLIGKAPFVNLLKFKDIEQSIQAENFEIIETGTLPEPFSRFVVARKL